MYYDTAESTNWPARQPEALRREGPEDMRFTWEQVKPGAIVEYKYTGTTQRNIGCFKCVSDKVIDICASSWLGRICANAYFDEVRLVELAPLEE